MKLEDAIVYLLASSGHGMRTKQVYAVIMSHPETFCKSEGRIRLMI